MTEEGNLRDRVDAIKSLLDAFKLERSVYLGVTVVSVIILLVSTISLLLKDSSQTPAILGLFGSTGTITYSAGRVLRMWNDALQVLGTVVKEN
jgi:hypothetical protein